MADERTVLLKIELDTSELEKRSKDAADNIARLREQQKGLDKTTAEGQLEYKKLQVEIQKYNKELTSNLKAIKAAEIRQTANTGSLREMREELANAKLIYAEFTAEQRESAEGQEFVNAMKDLKDSITDVEQSFGTFTGTVGNYEEAIKNALGEQYLLEKSFEDLATSNDTLESKFEQLNKKVEITPKTLNGLNAQMEAYKAIALQAGEANDQVIRQEALDKAAALKDQYMDLEREINNLANDQFALQGAMEIGQTAIASVGLYQSAMAALGIEGEEFEQMLIKLQVAQTALSSLQQISVVIQKQSAAAQLLQAQASRVQAVAMSISNKLFGEGTKAAKGFSKALIFTGIGALIAGLGILIAKWDDIKASLSSVSEEQQILNEHLDDYKQGATDAITKTNEVEVAFDLARKGVISKDEALLKYNETLGESFGEMNNLNDAEATFIAKKDAFIQASAERALAQALLAKAAEEEANAITASLENQVDAAEVAKESLLDPFFALKTVTGNNEKEIKRLQEEGVKDAEKTGMARAKLLIDQAKNYFASAEALEEANGIISESESNLEDDRKKRADEQKKRMEQEIKDAEALANRIRELNTLERELTLSDERKVLEAHYEFLETIAGDNANELLKIQEKKNADLRALELKELEAAESAITQKYEKELSDAKGNAELIASIEAAKQAEIDSIRLEANNTFVQREIEFIEKQKQLDEERLMNERTINEEVKILALELALEKVKGSELEFEAWQALQNERIAQLQRYRDAELAIEGKTASEKEKIENNAALQIEKIRNESFAAEETQNENKLNETKQLSQSVLNNANQLAQSLFQITSNRIQKEINAATQQYNTDTELLQQQLDANLISQADFDAQKSQLDTEFQAKESKLKKEQFEKDRTASLINAGIATALAIAQALPNIPLSVTAGVLGGAQIAFIASQPVPEFEKGGVVKEGVFGGKRHSNGGTKGVFSDGTRVEVEKDEAFFILNRRATAAISALSNHNVAHGGASFYENGGLLKFEGGGAFAASQTNGAMQRFSDQNAFVEAVKALPPGVVLVEQAANALDNQRKIEVGANW